MVNPLGVVVKCNIHNAYASFWLLRTSGKCEALNFVILKMLRVAILGTGNIAIHLLKAFLQSETIEVVQVVGRNTERVQKFSGSTSVSYKFTQIAEADVYLIAVKDDAIPEVSAHLTHAKGIVAHTSGARTIDCLAAKNRGVFYPLQTFTEGKPVNFASVPICIEAQNSTSLATLQQLAEALSKKVHTINSEKRKKLHLAAVFVNNFSNHLYCIGQSLCQQQGLPFSLLRPLILETAQKIQSLSPLQAQTGPARRGDKKSIQEHLSLLRNPTHVELYQLLTKAIQQAYEEEL